MRFFLPLSVFAFVMLVAFPVMAEVKSDPARLLLSPPMLDPPRADGSRCFFVINDAPYTVMGGIKTNYYDATDGTKARASADFRLRPQERNEICTRGPFYPGERVELVLRSIVPLFSCYTAAQGEIIIHGEIKPEGGTRTWAECE